MARRRTITSAAISTALTARGASEECASKPRTWQRTLFLPLWPTVTFMSVGSPMMQAHGLIGMSRSTASRRRTPTQPISSSKENARLMGVCRERVNNVVANALFIQTQYGAADAAKMLDVSYTWGGSTKADVGEMINAFNAAISAKADGIAVCVVDKAAFEAPIKRAMSRGIPVVAYNADGARTGTKARMAYIGQDLYVSGFEMGKRIVEQVPRGDVAIFIATPGALNIQPRIDGALAAIKQSGKPVKAKAVATSPDLATELSMIDAYYQGHKSLKGMFAVDAGDTQG